MDNNEISRADPGKNVTSNFINILDQAKRGKRARERASNSLLPSFCLFLLKLPHGREITFGRAIRSMPASKHLTLEMSEIR